MKFLVLPLVAALAPAVKANSYSYSYDGPDGCDETCFIECTGALFAGNQCEDAAAFVECFKASCQPCNENYMFIEWMVKTVETCVCDGAETPEATTACFAEAEEGPADPTCMETCDELGATGKDCAAIKGIQDCFEANCSEENEPFWYPFLEGMVNDMHACVCDGGKTVSECSPPEEEEEEEGGGDGPPPEEEEEEEETDDLAGAAPSKKVVASFALAALGVVLAA